MLMSSANLRLLAVKKKKTFYIVLRVGESILPPPFSLITPLTSLTMSIRTTDKFLKFSWGETVNLCWRPTTITVYFVF